MKKSRLKWTAALAVLAASAALAGAAEPTLRVGSPAPKLQTGKWVQGEPVKSFEKDKVYVVEFWATWCGPCKVSIPHLNEIHNKFKDKGLIVIGQDCWENDESLVAPFLKSMGEKMTYRVVLDDKAGADNDRGMMAKTWMDAAGQSGIPTAFIVDKKGLIAWIGHPMELTEKLIEDVLAGTFDVQKAAAEYETRQKNQSQVRAIATELTSALQRKDWDAANAKLDEVAKLLPESQRASLELTRFRILVSKGDYPAAYKLAERLSDENKDNAVLQNAIAWMIATGDGIEKRDLRLAEKIAARANDAAKGQNPAILDTLARVQFMNGKKADAIATQEKAVKTADDDLKPSLQKSLDSYRKGELPKED